MKCNYDFLFTALLVLTLPNPRSNLWTHGWTWRKIMDSPGLRKPQIWGKLGLIWRWDTRGFFQHFELIWLSATLIKILQIFSGDDCHWRLERGEHEVQWDGEGQEEEAEVCQQHHRLPAETQLWRSVTTQFYWLRNEQTRCVSAIFYSLFPSRPWPWLGVPGQERRFSPGQEELHLVGQGAQRGISQRAQRDASSTSSMIVVNQTPCRLSPPTSTCSQQPSVLERPRSTCKLHCLRLWTSNMHLDMKVTWFKALMFETESFSLAHPLMKLYFLVTSYKLISGAVTTSRFPQYILFCTRGRTWSSSTSSASLLRSYDVTEMYKYLDLVNVMGYDYHGATLYISKKMRVNDDQTTMGPKVGGMTGAECVAIVLELIYDVCVCCVQCTTHLHQRICCINILFQHAV